MNTQPPVMSLAALDADEPGRYTEAQIAAGASDGATIALIDPTRCDILVIGDHAAPGRNVLVRIAEHILTPAEAAEFFRNLADKIEHARPDYVKEQ